MKTIITRLMKLLTRRGVLVEDMGQTYPAEPDAGGDEAHALRPLQAAAITCSTSFGPRDGHKVSTLQGAIPREPAPRQSPVRADTDGFSLHAAVRVEARPQAAAAASPLHHPHMFDERVQCNAAGQVKFKLKAPRCDGTMHSAISPMEFIQTLAALIPRRGGA